LEYINSKIKEKFVNWGDQWLNPVGRLVLDKGSPFGSSSISILFFVIPHECQKRNCLPNPKFLWEGGKTNKKKFHMINWRIVRAPKMHGGLGVKDPTLANLALGEKMLWRMISGDYANWKKTLVNKYFQRDRLRGVEIPIGPSSISPIWKSLQVSLPLLQSQLSWIPGNGKSIRIWEDKILHKPPLIQEISLTPLREWLHAQNKYFLNDISIWDIEGLWKGWNLGNIPEALKIQADQLLSHMQGVAPIIRTIQILEDREFKDTQFVKDMNLY
jgi:hypothetical protein